MIAWLKAESERVSNGVAARCERMLLKSVADFIGSFPSSSASSSRFVLLKWCCVLYPVEVKRKNAVTRKALLESMALLLSSLLDETNSSRHAIRRTSVRCTRRAFRSVSYSKSEVKALLNLLNKTPSELLNAISTLLEVAKAKKDTLYPIPLLGLIFDVLIHLNHVPEDSKRLPEDIKVSRTNSALIQVLSENAAERLHHDLHDGNDVKIASAKERCHCL